MSLTSRILQPNALEPLERAIAGLRPDDPLRDQVILARDSLLEQIEPLALLQPEASALLAGDHLAARRFEALLEKLALETEPEADPALTVPEKGAASTTASLTKPERESPENEQRREAHELMDEPRDDPFVHLDNLLAVSVALGVLPLDTPRFLSLFGALTTCAGAILELEELNAAALIYLQHGNPQPMQTLAWRGKAPRPKRKAKPTKKPKPKKRPGVRFKSKIKDTHSAFMSCFRGAASRARAEALAAPKFSIISVTPIDACPGHQITIRGTNFGTVGGTVAFHTPSGSASDYQAINADSWADTAIVLTVPTWAREGRLHVSPTDHVFVTCFRKWAVNRVPDPNAVQNDGFLGGLPDIFAFQVNGRDFKAWAAPDSQATVSWVTTSGTVKIDIHNDEDVTEPRFKVAGPGGTGSTKWPTKAVTAPTKYIVRMTVTNHCGSVSKEVVTFVTVPAVVEIAGVEVTQGIQVFSIIGGQRNTVPTVAYKDTIVRLYASSNRNGFMSDKSSHFTAVLTIDGQMLQPINKAPAGSSSGGDPYLDLGYVGAIVREQVDSSFNFRIPAALCVGVKSFKVEVWGIDEFGFFTTVSQFVHWTWNTKPALKVRYVRVAYMGVLATPAESMFSLQRAFDLLPSPALDLGASWLDTWNTGQDLTNDEGKAKLLDHLTDAHNCADSEWLFPWEDDCPDDDGALWLGVVPGLNGGIANLGKNTAWAGLVSDRSRRVSGGHELAHLRCLRHVNQGCNGTNPAGSEPCGGGDEDFDGLPVSGQVLEVAFDPWYNVVVPSPRYDFMTYACNRWTSEANWNRLYAAL